MPVVALVVLFPRFSPAAMNPRDRYQPKFYQILREGSGSFHNGDYAKAKVQIDEAVALARKIALAGDLASALRMSGDLEAASGSFSVAISRYREALTLRTVVGDRICYPAILEALGDAETKTGDLASAQTDLKNAFRMYKDLGDATGTAMAARDLGTVAYELGSWVEANQWFSVAMAALPADEKPDIVADIQGRQALLLSAHGDTVGARTLLAKTMAHWQSRNHPRWIAQTQFQLAQVEARAGNIGEARRLFDASCNAFHAVGDKYGEGQCVKASAALPPDTRNRTSTRKAQGP
ncbi:MAG: tetratricopeptide repeat protein [Armatimonadetes bacterium]|nr:tetratricopeptide repeat protein [Armatimonadota bacterium]